MKKIRKTIKEKEIKAESKKELKDKIKKFNKQPNY